MSNITYPKYKLPDNLVVSTVTASVGFSGSFIGDGSQLENLPLGDYVTKVEASGTFISSSQLSEILTDYPTLDQVSGTFVSQSQIENFITGVATFGNLTGSGIGSDPVILKNEINVYALTASYLLNGQSVNTIGLYSHAEGVSTKASGNYSHAEGAYNDAYGHISHAEGINTQAYGDSSHTEGSVTRTYAPYSHAEGDSTETYGTASHAEGFKTIASASYQHVQGKWNKTSSTALHLIGNGTSNINRSNIFEVYTNKIIVSGSQEVSGNLSASYLYGDGSNLLNVPQPTIPDVSENLTFYVSQNGIDGIANGSLSKPFQTIQAAVDYVSSSVDHTASVVIKVAPGSYTAPQLTRRNTYFVSTALKTESRSVTFSGMTHVSCSSVSQGAYNNVVGFQGIFFTKSGTDTDPTFKVSTNGYTVFLKDCYVAASSNTDSNAVLLTSDLITGVNGSKLVVQNSIFWKEKSSADLLRIGGGYTKLDSCEFYYSSISGSGNGIGHTGTLGASVVIGDRLLIDLPTSGSAISSSVGSLSSPGFLLSNSSANVSGSNIVFRTGGHMLLTSVLVNSTGGSINYVSGSGLASSFVSYGNITCLNPTRAFVVNNATPIPLTEYHGTVIASSITSSISGTLIGPAGGILSGTYPNPSGLAGGIVPISSSVIFRTLNQGNYIHFAPSGAFGVTSYGTTTNTADIEFNAKTGHQWITTGNRNFGYSAYGYINLETCEIPNDSFNNGQINIGVLSRNLCQINIGTTSESRGNPRITIGRTGTPIILSGSLTTGVVNQSLTSPSNVIIVTAPTINLSASSNLTMSARPAVQYSNFYGNNYVPQRNASNGTKVTLINTSNNSICFLNDNSLTGSTPDNQSTHPSSSLKLGATQRVLNKWGSLELQYQATGSNDAGFWVETGFSNNLNGYSLSDLTDVSASNGKSNGDLLAWDNINTVWKNTKELNGNYTINGSLIVATTDSTTTATGLGSIAHGLDTEANGDYSHAQGWDTIANGSGSHAEGDACLAAGNYSHAEGYASHAEAAYSHAEGYGTHAITSYQHVEGLFNQTSSTALHLIGNGSNEENRSNIFEVYTDKVVISGSLNITSLLKAPQTTKINSDPGELGQICWDNNNIFVYTNAGWKSGSLN